MMDCGQNKAVKLFADLEGSGLIERKKQGQGRPARIYVKNFILPPLPGQPKPEQPPEDGQTSDLGKSALPKIGGLDFPKEDANKIDKNKTDLSDTDLSANPPPPAPSVSPPAGRTKRLLLSANTMRPLSEPRHGRGLLKNGNGGNCMTKQIDVLVVEPGQAPRVTQAENTLEAFETIIGAPTDVGCYLPQRVMLVCRENAKHDGYIAGKFLLCGLGEDGFDSLNPAQQSEFQKKCSMRGGGII